MSTPRHVRHHRSGPVTLDLSATAAIVQVSVADVDRAGVTLSPATPGDRTAEDLVARATVETTGDRLAIRVPAPPAGVGGGVTVINHSGGRVRMTQFHTGGGDFIGGDSYGIVAGHITGTVTVNGVRVSPDSTGMVKVVATVPRGCSLVTGVVAGDVITSGALRSVRHKGTSVGLEVAVADEVDAQTVSGPVRIARCDRVAVKSVSGAVEIGASRDVRAETVSGRIGVALLAGAISAKTTSGRIHLRVVGDSKGSAKSVSGRIEVERADNTIRAQITTSSVSGRISTPGW